MSVYLLGSNNAKPQAAFGDGPSDSEEMEFENSLLAAGHAIPLMWMFLFKVPDLLDHPINQAEENSLDENIKIPCIETRTAATRLQEQKPLINKWFGNNGALDYHIDMFSTWLESLPYRYLSLDWYELMVEEGLTMTYFVELLAAVDAADQKAVSILVNLSTIDPAIRFITLEDADAGNLDEAEQHNFFYLMGDGDHHVPPWSK